MSKRIAARHLHATDFDHEHAWGDFSGHEQRLILAVALWPKRRSRSISAPVSFGNILSSRGSNPGMAHPLEFNTIHERSAESVQPRAAPVKAGINLPNCNFGLSLWSRLRHRLNTLAIAFEETRFDTLGVGTKIAFSKGSLQLCGSRPDQISSASLAFILGRFGKRLRKHSSAPLGRHPLPRYLPIHPRSGQAHPLNFLYRA
jgi:hypothetical protein